MSNLKLSIKHRICSRLAGHLRTILADAIEVPFLMITTGTKSQQGQKLYPIQGSKILKNPTLSRVHTYIAIFGSAPTLFALQCFSFLVLRDEGFLSVTAHFSPSLPPAQKKRNILCSIPPVVALELPADNIAIKVIEVNVTPASRRSIN